MTQLHESEDYNPDITGLTSDSRAVKPGFLFAALVGSKSDGRQFIPDALMRGAQAIIAPSGTRLPAGSPAVLIEDDEPRRLYARLCARFHGAQPENVVAVTGTNGKTSTARFAAQLWRLTGRRSASLGTLGLDAPNSLIGDLSRDGGLTTPDAATLHADLSLLKNSGIEHLALEASSHGLDQYRLDGVDLAAAAFTNLTRDHLDYHGTMEAYFTAKSRLFRELLPRGATAVLNADSPYYSPLYEIAKSRGLRLIDFGRNANALKLVSQSPLPHGQHLRIQANGVLRDIDLPLVGMFQAENALAALGLTMAVDGSLHTDALIQAFTRLQPVRGRMELAATLPHGAAIYVDYAHTPDGLETVLNALRHHVRGKLVVAFGCGGDRDNGKRPIMGEIAARLANRVFVTDDNPRSEDPAKIRAAILAACPDATEIGDRAEAIRAAVASLRAGDVLVVAGKGHEQGQIIGSMTRPFDDASEIRTAMRELWGAHD